ncbi:hypothetical protein [Marinifilum caeruleilacunae]|uniref:Zinc-binding metallo-peptidase n=1 Tax=Marinifilum caeruleilacunae TaxID=2499076 RepID=A0ABX1X144_9BACT|nr:hypothetical protein [Marinifilum caeruleilacunae]NOU62092.1 hypothetical protein [Marinifilum caeruleilacunae]
MKYLLRLKWALILLLFSFVIVSCSKDDDTPDNQDQQITDNIGKDDKDGDNGHDHGSSDFDYITNYEVKGDQLKKIKDYDVTGESLTFQKNEKQHKDIWKLVMDVIPDANRNYLSDFMLFHGEKSGTAGYVVQTKEDLTKWQFGIAMAYAFPNGVINSDGELAYTIIHEFGHIVTLNNTQVTAGTDANSSDTYHTGEGSSKANSYINKLYQNYWADIWDEYQEASNSEDEEKLAAFYEKYKERFVTQYASTNPGEDIAETFTYFVIKGDKPSGNSIADQKVRMLYEYEELIELRNYIRNNTKTKRSRMILPKAGAWKKANTFGDPKKVHNLTK